MVRDTQDNEPLSFITLSAATKNVTRYLNLDEKKDEETSGKANSRRSDEQRRADNERYISTRLREIAAWEKKLAGK